MTLQTPEWPARRTSGAKLVALVLALLAGCVHRGTSPPAEEQEAPYRIGPEDVLDVAVWRDPELTRTMPVRPDGFISLPLVGDVKAEGKTPHELAEELGERLGAFIQAPRVAVAVREVNSARVYVTGEVARPGAYPLRGRMSLVQLLALAGGFSDFADPDGIRVLRQGRAKTLAVRYRDLVGDGRGEQRFLLQPGDTVVVP